jgi:hypothetical protein|nr:hypothetical protein [Leifsonia xyli]
MTDFIAAFGWLLDPANAAGPGGIPTRAGEHILYSLLTLLLAGVIALPIGFLIGHTGRLRGESLWGSPERSGRCRRSASSCTWRCSRPTSRSCRR